MGAARFLKVSPDRTLSWVLAFSEPADRTELIGLVRQACEGPAFGGLFVWLGCAWGS